MVFPVVMYGCESWTIKKAERRRIDAFELWCWRRLLRVPWTARRSNQSILKEISPGCSLEGLMVKLKLQYFCYLMQRIDSLEKILMLGKIEGGRRRGWQKMRWLDGITDSMDMVRVDSNTLATWCKELTHWKRPWCWERLKVGREGDNRGWDGCMASLTQWTWVWASSRSWWWTGKPGVLHSMGFQRVRHNWVTELNWYLCNNPFD